MITNILQEKKVSPKNYYSVLIVVFKGTDRVLYLDLFKILILSFYKKKQFYILLRSLIICVGNRE